MQVEKDIAVARDFIEGNVYEKSRRIFIYKNK